MKGRRTKKLREMGAIETKKEAVIEFCFCCFRIAMTRESMESNNSRRKSMVETKGCAINANREGLFFSDEARVAALIVRAAIKWLVKSNGLARTRESMHSNSARPVVFFSLVSLFIDE